MYTIQKMKLTTEKGAAKLIAETYRLTFAIDRPFVYLDNAQGKRLAELFVLSSVHPLHGRDDSTRIESWQVEETPQEIVFQLRCSSSIWQEKIYRFRCTPQRFSYEVEVEGVGQLSEVLYFGGYYSGQIRWGSGFFWSGQKFQRGFTPAPNSEEANYFTAAESSVIDLMGVPLPGKADWFFTPSPFCFAFEGPGVWLGMGVEAQPGGNRYTELAYHGQKTGFHLALSFEGHTQVNGRYLLPAIGFDFGADEYAVLTEHVCLLQETRCTPGPRSRPKPAWWYQPIFCGWGEQCYQASLVKGKAPDYSRQALYDQFLDVLEKHGIDPGTVVLDDKWQATYGDNCADPQKWPDLPAFIRGQHQKGRKVLLWLKAWDPEGVPAEECITNAGGLALAVDPSNPTYEKRLRDSVRYMLSEEGYGADGFKIDFTARIPSGPGIRTWGDTWGLELMKLYLGIIYEEAKRTKPDALVMTHTPHPYLIDITDMIRLNDINMEKDVNRAMLLRTQVAEIACLDALIDTDNWPIKNKAAWRKYLKLQPELGIPSLYYATHIDSSKEPLNAGDYRLIREVWARYRASLKPSARPINRNRRSRSGGRRQPIRGLRALLPVFTSFLTGVHIGEREETVSI
jgi:hypothetical protein